MKPFIAPVFEALLQHAKSAVTGFHVPGHHGGKALNQPGWTDSTDAKVIEYFYKIMEIDVTELSSTDDLHHPEACIKEAQQLAALTFGSDDSYFLVGGSTSGNIALLLTVCEPNDLVIVQRNVHKSVLNGLRLAGARAVFLLPELESHSGLATIPSVQDVKAALAKYPEAKAVFLSNPNYYGMKVNLAPYAEAIHHYHIPLLVDEAHGAHFGMHSAFPRSALSEGADAVVQSAHKTLPTLTMGALLHVQGDRIARSVLSESLAMIQSSSPSFPIIASIDISRAMIDALGPSMFEQSLNAAEAFRSWLIRQDTDICEMTIESGTMLELSKDPLRVVLFDKTGRQTGFELQHMLETHGCYIEMADPRYAVLVFGIQTSLHDIQKLQYAITQLDDRRSKKQESIKELRYERGFFSPDENRISEPVSFARARFKNEATERIHLEDSVHHISAELVVPYPPGIAVLYPGEKITAAAITRIKELSLAGAKFQGASDGQMKTIAVYRE
ncbi:arginine/lysine/ornithine decarboxylase [Paenibacillus endophyticus]|uniref:Arginine/lysine/ornithine decarboxylase n=1 Tax=Paenibacillus endophyticus TaxID=1294268 RepID=A0A7W5CFP1_9BACL|nr:aminotransferase class I/II-fold pyridoxal phosphate-dependent enzyme [Paenibacillus endophyticus]MBB3156034.1 arginine/lysine/ornithine decarboxylase [Paenibacillus endophyticus]